MQGRYDKGIFWTGIVLSIVLFGIGLYIDVTTEAAGYSTTEELLEVIHWLGIGDKLKAGGIFLFCMTAVYKNWKRR